SCKGRRPGCAVRVGNVCPSAGAGFVVALAGDIQLMPGLGKEPAYTRIDIDASGQITALTQDPSPKRLGGSRARRSLQTAERFDHSEVPLDMIQVDHDVVGVA